jgi:hypothetical protein
MARPDLAFKVTGKIQVRADLRRKRVVISCVTQDGRSLQLETDYQALDRLHQEIQKQLAQ